MHVRLPLQSRTALAMLVAVTLLLPGFTTKAYGGASSFFAAGKLFRVGKGPRAYPDLQTAVNAAQDGDRILVTIDTCGANINKRLEIRGTGAATVFGLTEEPGEPCESDTPAINLQPDASGSRILNLTIANAEVGIVTYAPNDGSNAADDVEVFNNTMSDVRMGILAGRADRWTVKGNDITVSAAAGAPVPRGLLLTDGVDDWSIVENVITASVAGDVFGISLQATAACCSPQPMTNIRITSNVIAVTAGCCGNAHAIRLASIESDIDAVEITGNDLSGSDSAILLQAGADPADSGDDLSGLHQYIINVVEGWHLVTRFLSQGNLEP